jgi:pimeloyl-ACP methyl ester carboxylesterase
MTSRSRRRLVGASVYVGLLVASFVVRSRHPPIVLDGPHERVASTRAVHGERLLPDQIRIVYREFASPSAEASSAIVLIHGSPGHKEDFDELGPMLGERMRVIAPDLPGFGGSSHALPDYSFRAHAIYIRQLLDTLGIKRAHILGFSMGGGVALSFAALSPQRLASLTMLSAIGVQEMELTGDYYVNHVVHGAQLVGLWTLMEATPHMGAFDNAMLGLPYARNFYDSDQRPLRGTLWRLQEPALIIHGSRDMLVPYEAATEHHRLMPQSELVTLDGSHFELFGNAAYLATLIIDFVDRVEHGTARVRSNAEPDRVSAAAPFFGTPRFPHVRGIAASVVGLVLTTTALASGTVAAAGAGALAANDRIDLITALHACFTGMFVASLFVFVRRGSFQPDALDGLPCQWQSFITARSEWSFWNFVIASPVVLGVWATVAVLTSEAIGWLCLKLPATPSNLYVRAAIVLTITATTLRVVPLACTDKGRRLLVSQWLRLTRWEFWPPWVFYPPLLVYIVYLIVKHRSLTVFTAANPAIVAGGFVGESKYEILQALSGSAAFIARARLIEGSLTETERVSAAQTFMADEGLTFPIVLKPNNGQRGSGVVVVRSEEALHECLVQSTVDTIIQEYASGQEFGVFYYRHPSEAHGHIFSVTEKRFPTMVGDGRHTLEELILHDDRAVCSARYYLDRHQNQLTVIPAAGESVQLVELGTHCRGSMFLDGHSVMTPELEGRFEAIARGFEGFNFGRFDVRASAGLDAFRRGEAFKIIELNGVTSEATHIYHPGTPLWSAYRVLMDQWRIAFEIGEENQTRGAAPASVRQLLTLACDYRQTARAHLGGRSRTSP